MADFYVSPSRHSTVGPAAGVGTGTLSDPFALNALPAVIASNNRYLLLPHKTRGQVGTPYNRQFTSALRNAIEIGGIGAGENLDGITLTHADPDDRAQIHGAFAFLRTGWSLTNGRTTVYQRTSTDTDWLAFTEGYGDIASGRGPFLRQLGAQPTDDAADRGTFFVDLVTFPGIAILYVHLSNDLDPRAEADGFVAGIPDMPAGVKAGDMLRFSGGLMFQQVENLLCDLDVEEFISNQGQCCGITYDNWSNFEPGVIPGTINFDGSRVRNVSAHHISIRVLHDDSASTPSIDINDGEHGGWWEGNNGSRVIDVNGIVSASKVGAVSIKRNILRPHPIATSAGVAALALTDNVHYGVNALTTGSATLCDVEDVEIMGRAGECDRVVAFTLGTATQPSDPSDRSTFVNRLRRVTVRDLPQLFFDEPIDGEQCFFGLDSGDEPETNAGSIDQGIQALHVNMKGCRFRLRQHPTALDGHPWTISPSTTAMNVNLWLCDVQNVTPAPTIEMFGNSGGVGGRHLFARATAFSTLNGEALGDLGIGVSSGDFDGCAFDGFEDVSIWTDAAGALDKAGFIAGLCDGQCEMDPASGFGYLDDDFTIDETSFLHGTSVALPELAGVTGFNGVAFMGQIGSSQFLQMGVGKSGGALKAVPLLLLEEDE